jgi:hypothetical protein
MERLAASHGPRTHAELAAELTAGAAHAAFLVLACFSFQKREL